MPPAAAGATTGSAEAGMSEKRPAQTSVLQDPVAKAPQVRGQGAAELPSASLAGRDQRGDLVVAEAIGVQLFEIIARIVDEKSRDIVIPQREGEAAGAAILIGEVEAVIVVAAIGAAIHVVQAIVVEPPIDREAAGVIVDHVENH